MDTAKKFLQLMLETIVDDPSAVSIEVKQDEMGVLLMAKVAPADMGHVIGKQGKTAEAIRELLRVIGYKARAKISFKLEEPPGRERPQHSDRGYNDVVDDLKKENY